MTIGEKVSYIKGLAEGLGLEGDTKEGKILNAIIDNVPVIIAKTLELNPSTPSVRFTAFVAPSITTIVNII